MNLDFNFTPALGDSPARAVMREQASDFVVYENLSFELEGQGDHVYLYIEKVDNNTDWVASRLAKLAGLKAVDIGFAGLKDRHAITRQWFSLHMPNKPEPNWTQLGENIRVLERTRHTKKLKTGAIKHNEFVITLRHLQGSREAIHTRLEKVKTQGFPNYFGAQRFGREQANVMKLLDMINKRLRMRANKRGILISAGRSYLFNQILKQRVLANNWNQAIAGDVMNLDGSRGIFIPECYDDTINARVQQMDIHPAAVLWGRGQSQSRELAAQIEHACLEKNQEIAVALEKVGASLAYRTMRVRADSLQWQFLQDDILELTFSLPSGAYATSLINEIINVHYLSDSNSE